MILPDGRISPHDFGIWKDEHVEMLSRITEFILAQGAAPGIQLAHAGAEGQCGHAVEWRQYERAKQ